MEWHGKSIVYVEHLNMNIRSIKQLTNLSVEREEQDEYSYSPVKEPKVLDKDTWCIRRKQNGKVQTAPYGPHPGRSDSTGDQLWWREHETTQTYQ